MITNPCRTVLLLAVALRMASALEPMIASDSLPAFRSDSSIQDPIRRVESGNSPFAGKTGQAAGSLRDSGSGRADSLALILSKRKMGIALYLGVDFIDFDGKEKFQNALNARIAADSLKALQNYESVHLAFPIGIQAVLPVSDFLDVVAKTHSYWYKQTAIMGNRKTSSHAGDEWYAVQANLIGCGLRYYVPPTLLSVAGEVGFFTQGLWYWNLGNSELYSPYGNARARFDASGSGYEIQLGFHKALLKPWKLTGSIGFLHQEFSSRKSWQNLLAYAASSDKVNWSSSAAEASLNLWYYFGVESAPPPSKPAAVDTTRRF